MQLPALREDLQLSEAAPAFDGAPQWVLNDPLRGRYFKLGEAAVRLLRHWARGVPPAVLAAANQGGGRALGEDDLEQLLRFLREHDLVAPLDPEQRASYANKLAARRESLWQKALHQYLFFRIPLWRPDPFLERTWPWLARHGGALLRFGLPAVLALGLFLVARDWDRFIGGFSYLFSWSGALAFGVALWLAKFCHELGHAYMAKRAGCRVHSMGIAFVVLLPMFYTDVSDAWRVSDRRSRLLIGAGGVLAELLLACVALLAWSLLADGPLRTAAFLLASATWVTTVAINLNPFMRFDGYFLLSDLLAVDNLQGRAFALCRWRLREALFGYGAPMPEPWPPRLRRQLLLWGYASWLWRVALFFGIALAVYHLFFKVLGIFLMLVELGWFIALPICRELKLWWQHRERAERRRAWPTLGAGLALLLVLLVPWRTSVEVPAVLEASQVAEVHTPVAGRVVRVLVAEGQALQAGEPMLELESPDIEARLGIAGHEIRALQLQIARASANPLTVADAGVLESQLAQSLADYRGLAAQRERLLLRAPQAGVVRDLDSELRAGQWLAPEQLLLRVVGEQRPKLRGYVEQQALARLAPGAEGRFIAEQPGLATLPVRLAELDTASSAALALPLLASDLGGPLAVRRDAEQRAVPEHAQYGARLDVQGEARPPLQALRGVAVLDGRSESILGGFLRRLAALGVRESGF
ncbi:HlyD family efflux transporter periplasmic adaptor subunit [Pseudomonas citronellolis]|uniref:HlyD family efflux transporter periplasmic adaptor subunit n=1 Tax=Pseudomonas citronellolis TaxID=53408 RepID=UPI0023E44C6B|nr:HlyD family efflux transporter periplasmic adaptor subunit [Pseudomonas citronellolis]MDF3932363.1 HlyD family efflux transporter periplasmic adaptor subunit [Pseudomonas citronellolis]